MQQLIAIIFKFYFIFKKQRQTFLWVPMAYILYFDIKLNTESIWHPASVIVQSGIKLILTRTISWQRYTVYKSASFTQWKWSKKDS